MELLAAIRGLEALKRPCQVQLYTDSVYVRDGITKWIHGWRKNGWRTADRKPVKNAELWQELVEAAAPHRVEWHWVKGHSGHPENDRADALACDGAAQFAKRAAEIRRRIDRARRRARAAGAAASVAAAGAVWMPKPPCPAHQKKPRPDALKP